MNDEGYNDGVKIGIVIGIVVFVLAALLVTCSQAESKPLKTPEQIQSERETKYNNTGKAIHELLRGAAGKEKSK